MLALCLILLVTYYALIYASIIGQGLIKTGSLPKDCHVKVSMTTQENTEKECLSEEDASESDSSSDASNH